MTKLAVENLRGTASNPSNGLTLTMRIPHARLLITERSSAWRAEVVDRLNHICRLSPGWDGYRAGPISFSTADFAFRVLDAVCGPDTPTPSIVPGVSGDLQIEWHLHTGDIELHVRSPNDVIAWRQTSDTGLDGEELLLTNDFTAISKWIESLLEPTSAVIGAAA